MSMFQPILWNTINFIMKKLTIYVWDVLPRQMKNLALDICRKKVIGNRDFLRGERNQQIIIVLLTKICDSSVVVEDVVCIEGKVIVWVFIHASGIFLHVVVLHSSLVVFARQRSQSNALPACTIVIFLCPIC